MSIPTKFATQKEAKEHGWFSRRHETDSALQEARRKRAENKARRTIK
jgi:hypothetical protein